MVEAHKTVYGVVNDGSIDCLYVPSKHGSMSKLHGQSFMGIQVYF